jgi:Bacteriocin-protection, YdeI or OmpD-Associated/Domain of unknown function (DUF1905)
VKQTFGRVRAPVRVAANGHVFPTTTMRYGGVDYIGFNREVREAAGIAAGAVVALGIELDTEDRVVSVPHDLVVGLGRNHEAEDAFAGLSYTHRKEYVRWIEAAKRDETRRKRVEKTVAMLCEGVRHP